MQNDAGMWPMWIVRENRVKYSFCRLPCKEEEAERQKGRFRTILLDTAQATTQEAGRLRSITLHSHGKNKWLRKSPNSEKDG